MGGPINAIPLGIGCGVSGSRSIQRRRGSAAWVDLKDLWRACGTTEWVAEKVPIPRKLDERNIAGAEARRLFCCVCGTTEVVP